MIFIFFANKEIQLQIFKLSFSSSLSASVIKQALNEN